MVPNHGDLMKKASLFVAALAALAVACSTAGGRSSAPAAVSEVLHNIQVDHEGEVTIIGLVGPTVASYDISQRMDPLALVMQLEAVSLRLPVGSVPVFDGLVEQVSISAHRDSGTTRVEVSLAVAARHEVVATSTGMALRLWADDGSWRLDAETLDEPMAADDLDGDPWLVSGSEASLDSFESDAGALSGTATEWVEPPVAQTLEALTFEVTEAGVLVNFSADGMIGATETFTLRDPARFVIDLPGVKNGLSQNEFEVGSDVVAKIRVGAHSDKVRIVIDGGTAARDFEGRRVLPTANGLMLTIGDGSDLDAAFEQGIARAEQSWLGSQDAAAIADTEFGTEEGEIAADATPAAIDGAADPWASEETQAIESDTGEIASAETAAEEAAIEAGGELESDVSPVDDRWAAANEATGIHGIHYEADWRQGRERIVVLAEAPVAWETHEPDAETFILSLKGAVLAEGAGGQIAPDARGALMLITAFQQPDLDPQEVRVVIKRSAGLQPTVTARGALVFIDFPLTSDPASLAAVQPTMTDNAMTGEGNADFAIEMSAVDPTAPVMPTEAIAEIATADFERIAAPLAIDLAAATSAPAPPALAPAPLAAPASLEPPASIELLQEGGLIDGKEYSGRRVSLDFKDVEIADVLRLIAEVSDLNVIAGDEVKGKVTIRLVDVPWDQALDVILLTKGLGFVRVGNVLRIAPVDILAREEESRLQERRAKEKLEDLALKLIPVNYADVKSMERLIKRLLSPRGTVNIDERTSTIIVKDISSVIDEAYALVMAIDTETPQVMIEAKLVEAALSFARELGTVWSISTQPLVDAFDDSLGLRQDLGGQDFLLNGANSLSFVNNITSFPTGLGTLSALILDQKFNVDVQIQAAESTGNGKVISSPRIVTLDNTDAEIIQGVSIPFQTFENGDARLEFVDAVLSLKVTPHITADKHIIMKIELTRDAPDETVQTPTGSPAIAKNQAKTETMVKDGQTLVLGGIYTIEKSYRQSRVPYLHAIPIFGALFKSKEVSDARKELLMFVTPRIVVQPDDEA